MSYQGYFAYYYDMLNSDCDYDALAQTYEDLFHRHGCKPQLVLDLGCGSGNLTLPLSQKGYDMIGVDLSWEMLEMARDKTAQAGLQEDILYLNQDMTDFELYGTVDGVICGLDGINYLTDKRDVLRCFKLVSLYLNPQGMFLFDLNTPYKFQHVLGNNTFVYDMEQVYCVWQNHYDPKSKLCEFDITLFAQEGDHYVRYEEQQIERAYQVEEVENLLKRAGLRLEGVYREKDLGKPQKTSQRLFFAARKI